MDVSKFELFENGMALPTKVLKYGNISGKKMPKPFLSCEARRFKGLGLI